MRKAILVGMGLAMVAVLLGAGEPGVSKEVLGRHLKLIGDALPMNWTVRADADGTGLWVEGKAAVPMENMSPSQSVRMPGEAPLMGVPGFFVRVGVPRTAAEVAAMVKANADREKVLEMLRAQMADMVVVVKPNSLTESFAARTPEQQARLDAFVAVQRAMPAVGVPTLFVSDASFEVVGNSYLVPARAADRAEVEAVRQIVAKLYADTPGK